MGDVVSLDGARRLQAIRRAIWGPCVGDDALAAWFSAEFAKMLLTGQSKVGRADTVRFLPPDIIETEK